MINFIIGENSSGKTLYLENKLLSLGISDCVTNLENMSNPQKLEISQDKIDILKLWTPFDIRYNGEEISIPNLKVDMHFTKFVKDICSDVSNFIYDEPERKIGMAWHSHVYDIMNRLSEEFKEFWVTSHNQHCMSSMNARYFRCKNKYDLEEVSEEEAYEILDTI